MSAPAAEINARLTRCFAVVFPDLSPDRIPLASQPDVPGWDSVAAITLLTVVEEEFGIKIDLELLPDLDSFAALSEHLSRQ
jgi:acyl carrier protein